MRFLSHYEEINAESSALGFDLLQRWGIAVRNSEAITMTCKQKSILNMLVSTMSYCVHRDHPEHVRAILLTAHGPFEDEKYKRLAETTKRLIDSFTAISEGEEKEFFDSVDSLVCLRAEPLGDDS